MKQKWWKKVTSGFWQNQFKIDNFNRYRPGTKEYEQWYDKDFESAKEFYRDSTQTQESIDRA